MYNVHVRRMAILRGTEKAVSRVRKMGILSAGRHLCTIEKRHEILAH